MSEFDKEAERERLREKYERDEEKREVTERMSELLLKGATMTNAHCQDCGDPIFRYDGQEFCATCQKAVQRDAGDADADAEDGDGTTANGDREEIHVAAPDETRVQFGGDEQPPEDATEKTPTEGDRQPEPRAQQTSPQGQQRANESAASQLDSGDAGTQAAQGGDLPAAQDALSRTITQLARQAEASQDLGQKRDLLAATREAAEALSALREAGR